MVLSDYITTFGQVLLKHYGKRVHKISIDARFSCPNRDGTKGIGGCTFCNNISFSPNGRQANPITEQINAGRQILPKRTGAKSYIAYFQAYTNTYADFEILKQQYDMALSAPDVIGLSVGTRPDCVPEAVLDLLAEYKHQGYEIWLELGLQSAFDDTLERVNRGHGFAEYKDTTIAARERGIPVCTHLIAGLPGENIKHNISTLEQVLDVGVDGLKLHPLHVVRGTQLANQWRRGEYTPLELDEYIDIAVSLINMTPREVIYHRVTGTAADNILLAPSWCNKKWLVINRITTALAAQAATQAHNTTGTQTHGTGLSCG